MSLDPLGILLFLPMIICLLLAIMWGGSTYPWSNARIIVLFVLGGLLLIGFVWLQVYESDRAMVPLSVARDRTVWASCIFSFFLFGSLLVLTYYLPIWFQAIKGSTASESGIRILPLLLGSVVLSLIGGVIVSVNGYYTWLCILSSVLVSVVRVLRSNLLEGSNTDRSRALGKWTDDNIQTQQWHRTVDRIPSHLRCRDRIWHAAAAHCDPSCSPRETGRRGHSKSFPDHPQAQDVATLTRFSSPVSHHFYPNFWRRDPSLCRPEPFHQQPRPQRCKG